jgi:hypothetical protein
MFSVRAALIQMKPLMDHDYVEEQSIADRYLGGRLSSEEEQAFELHLMECEICVQRVEEFDGLRAGLRRVRATARRGPVPMPAWPKLAMAACLGFVVAAVPAYLLLQELTKTRQALTAERGRSGVAATAPNPEMAAAQFHRFEIVRGEQADNLVVLPSQPAPIVIAIRLDAPAEAVSFRATISTAAGATVAQKSDLSLSGANNLVLTFPSTLLTPGDYILKIESISRSRGHSEVATYRFRAAANP